MKRKEECNLLPHIYCTCFRKYAGRQRLVEERSAFVVANSVSAVC